MEQRKKIAYISITVLADSDLPLISELSKQFTIDYYLLATNTTRQGTVVNINLKSTGGIYPGTMYPELQNLQRWIDLKHVFIVNKPVNHDWEWLNFKVSWEWMKRLRRGHYDLIHLTWPLRYSSFPLYLLRRKMVLTMHDPIPHSSNQTFENRLHRWCCVHLTPNFILLNTTQREEFLRTYGIDESRVYQSRLSIYAHLKYTQAAPALCPHPYVLYIGSVQPHKGIEYLCKAMLSVMADTNDIRLVVAGKGTYYFDKSVYEQNPRFVFINRFITDEELASLISNCIAVVCPYIDATQSGVMMSAFALNKPVIATTVGALPEMMENGRHGYLVPPKDIRSLAESIRRIINPGKAQQLSEFIEKDFAAGSHSWSSIAKNMQAIYQEIIFRRKER